MLVAPTAATTAAPSVLLVDDDDVLRRALRRALVRDGFSVLEANCGEAALAVTHTATPDVIVLDLRMPGMDGHTLLRRLVKDDPDVAVVILTACGSRADVVDAVKHGAVDFIAKPWTHAALVLALRLAIERRQQLRASRSPSVNATIASWADAAAEVRAGRGVPRLAIEVTRLREQLATDRPAVAAALDVIDADDEVAVRVRRAVAAVRPAPADAREQVLRIGSRQVLAIAECVFVLRSFVAPGPIGRTLQRAAWRYGLAQAEAQRRLAGGGPDGDAAFRAHVSSELGAVYLLAHADDADLRAEAAALLPRLVVHRDDVGAALVDVLGLGGGAAIGAAAVGAVGVPALRVLGRFAAGPDPFSIADLDAGFVDDCCARAHVARASLDDARAHVAASMNEIEAVFGGVAGEPRRRR